VTEAASAVVAASGADVIEGVAADAGVAEAGAAWEQPSIPVIRITPIINAKTNVVILFVIYNSNLSFDSIDIGTNTDKGSFVFMRRFFFFTVGLESLESV
jgi:hypothetical protein